MKSSHSVKILAVEIEKLFISPLKGKNISVSVEAVCPLGQESHFCQLLCLYVLAGSSEMLWQAGWSRADALLPTASLCHGRYTEGQSSGTVELFLSMGYGDHNSAATSTLCSTAASQQCNV